MLRGEENIRFAAILDCCGDSIRWSRFGGGNCERVYRPVGFDHPRRGRGMARRYRNRRQAFRQHPLGRRQRSAGR